MSLAKILPKRKKSLDLLEQVLVLPIFFWFTWRLWPDNLSSTNWSTLVLLLSEGVVITLLLTRRKTDLISANFRDWAVAFAGTFLVLLVEKDGQPISGPGGGFLLLAGLATHMGAKFSLLRSFGLVAADRGIKQRGLYAVVRHPMYAGYIMTHIGFLLIAPSWWNLAVYIAAWALIIVRISAEERVLSANPQYRDYMTGVRYRFLPGVF